VPILTIHGSPIVGTSIGVTPVASRSLHGLHMSISDMFVECNNFERTDSETEQQQLTVPLVKLPLYSEDGHQVRLLAGLMFR
jgi:hypothetical protein